MRTAAGRRFGAGALLLAGSLAAAACTTGSGSPRPTDPRQILVSAIGVTAALPTVRLHGELIADMGPAAGVARARVTGSADAAVDLVGRQLTMHATTSMPTGANNVQAAPQVSDIILTRTAVFNRDAQTGRWRKNATSGFAGGPTNAQLATMLANLMSNPAITFELGEAGPCSLGTCDHVVAHIDGATLAPALGPLLGVPLDSASSQSIPSFDVDVRVDQATSVISEVRTTISSGGATEQLFLSVSDPGGPIQIAPPPPALVDDFTNNFGQGIAPEPSIEIGQETAVPMESVDAQSAP